MKTYKELQEDLESRRAEAGKQSASRTSGFTSRSRKEMKDNRGGSTPSSSGGNPEPKLAPLFRQTTKEISKGIVKKLLGKGKKKKNKNKEEPKSKTKPREPFKPKTGAAAGVPFKPKTKKVEKPEQKKSEQKKSEQKRLPPKPEQKRLPPASD
jgi:hypothetical protein